MLESSCLGNDPITIQNGEVAWNETHLDVAHKWRNNKQVFSVNMPEASSELEHILRWKGRDWTVVERVAN